MSIFNQTEEYLEYKKKVRELEKKVHAESDSFETMFNTKLECVRLSSVLDYKLRYIQLERKYEEYKKSKAKKNVKTIRTTR